MNKGRLYWSVFKLLMLASLIVWIILGMTGCSGTPMTPAKYEQYQRSCRNVGGVWYHYGPMSGRCDYDPYRP